MVVSPEEEWSLGDSGTSLHAHGNQGTLRLQWSRARRTARDTTEAPPWGQSEKLRHEWRHLPSMENLDSKPSRLPYAAFKTPQCRGRKTLLGLQSR